MPISINRMRIFAKIVKVDFCLVDLLSQDPLFIRGRQSKQRNLLTNTTRFRAKCFGRNLIMLSGWRIFYILCIQGPRNVRQAYEGQIRPKACGRSLRRRVCLAL